MDKGIRFLLLFVSCWSMAQTQVSLTADTLEVRLAEQINLNLAVSTEKQASIQFPPLKAFAPFEVIDTTVVDTTVSANKFVYSKTYAVIQFDSGQFTLPQQIVVVDGAVFSTDSLLVRVKDVAVDTLEQPLFPIKTILPMAKNTAGWWKPYGYGFLIIMAAVLLYVFIVRTQKRIRAKREKMPPFERAIQALQALESIQLDKQEAYKDYYSEMTDIVRNYLEDETNIDALESTSDELLTKLELLRDSGNLELTNATIDQLKQVLSTADLVKFARALPEEYLARLDREKIELVVKDTKAALPEPTEEERLQNEAYARMRRKQQQIKRIKTVGFSLLGALAITATVMIYNYGAMQSKDRVFGHPTLKWLHQEWVSSTYGISAMSLKSPDVLSRKTTQNRLNQQFVLGSLEEAFMIVLHMEHSTAKEEQTIDLQQKVDKVIGTFDSMGATNIFQKQNDYKTTSGIEGIVASGSFDWTKNNKDTQRKTYEVYHFTENKGFQQLQLVYDRNDRYAKELITRMLNSIEFIKEKS